MARRLVWASAVERSTSEHKFQETTVRSQGSWMLVRAAARRGGEASSQRERRAPQVGCGGETEPCSFTQYHPGERRW